MLDQRGRLLRAALGFAGLPRPSYDRALWALRFWLDSWRGIGDVERGIARQGYDLQLTRYDARGWLRRRTRPEGLRALAAVPAFGVPASDPGLAKVPADRRGRLFVHVAEAIEAISGSCRQVAKEGFELLPHSPHSVEATLPAVSGAVNPPGTPWHAVQGAARDALRRAE